MIYSLIAILMSTTSTQAEEMKAVSEALHGDKMAVEYIVLNTGKHILMAKEVTKATGSDAKFKELQTIDLKIKDGEMLSIAHQFKCKTSRSNDFVYAVIAKSKINEKKAFHPERAWVVEENKMRIRTVQPRAVTCLWSPDSDSKYPF